MVDQTVYLGVFYAIVELAKRYLAFKENQKANAKRDELKSLVETLKP